MQSICLLRDGAELTGCRQYAYCCRLFMLSLVLCMQVVFDVTVINHGHAGTVLLHHSTLLLTRGFTSQGFVSLLLPFEEDCNCFLYHKLHSKQEIRAGKASDAAVNFDISAGFYCAKRSVARYCHDKLSVCQSVCL